jgi:hypothetical protein
MRTEEQVFRPVVYRLLQIARTGSEPGTLSRLDPHLFEGTPGHLSSVHRPRADFSQLGDAPKQQSGADRSYGDKPGV